MSPVPMPQRVRELRPTDAEGLRAIHGLAADAAARHHTLTDPALPPPERLALREQIATLDRGRALAEITLRGNGVPAIWIDTARRQGATGQPWTGEQILPPIPRERMRSSPRRVAEDIHLLADMAAVSAVRDHLSREGVPNDPAAVDAVQFRRNADAVWRRGAQTAHALGLRDSDHTRITRHASIDLERRIHRYLDLSPADIDVLWHAHTRAGIAETYRRSITANAPSGYRLTTTLTGPPDPQYWLDRAHTTVADAVAGRDAANPASADIDRAAAAALCTVEDTQALTTPQPPVLEPGPRAIEAGPDP
ncbi:hypothetical protein [Nocardia takedensis]|uniref:hypothetical protein n=1 Tax=Nocardia takedensis TaxID=259390 RepID=UPI0005935C51|nr:hypothetical protein [Nocardia takedensis]